MEKAAQLAATSNFGVFKEPRGFIKLLQFILAIFAFATTTAPSSHSEFTIQCNSTGELKTLQLPFYYPYRLTSSAQIQLPLCAETKINTTSPCCDYNSAAEFYVFVGVMAFLYSLAAILLYVVFDDNYRQNANVPKLDFVVTVVFALLWLISASAWADGVSNLKEYIDPSELFYKRIPECMDASPNTCLVSKPGDFATLNVSLIFGFLNLFVWAGNLWFLFKETAWFSNPDEVPNPAPQQAPPQTLAPNNDPAHI